MAPPRKTNPKSRAKAVAVPDAALAEVVWSLVNRAPGPSCWMWRGPRVKDKHGRLVYGYIQISRKAARSAGGGRRILIHRLVEAIVRGPLPAGIQVNHHCDNPPCARPEHLFRGTQVDNLADMCAKGRNRYVTFRGEQHVNAKLTDETVMQIRQRRAAGEPSIALARAFGVARSLIDRIARGTVWAHLPGPRTYRREAPSALRLLVLRATGLSWPQVAAELAVPVNTVFTVLQRPKPPRASRRALAQPLHPAQPRSIAPPPTWSLDLTEEQILDMARRLGVLRRPAA